MFPSDQFRVFQLFVIFFIHLHFSENAPLEKRPNTIQCFMYGCVVPVHIRIGNTPLEKINLTLAEAFKFSEKKEAQIAHAKERTNETNIPSATPENGAEKKIGKHAHKSNKVKENGNEIDNSVIKNKKEDAINIKNILAKTLANATSVAEKPKNIIEPIIQIPVVVQYQHIQKIPKS